MGKIYFVDTENTGNTWFKMLEKLNADDRFIVLYTENSAKLTYEQSAELQNYDDKIQLVKCYTGTNALDFQLCALVGYYINVCGENGQYIVLSKDKGYDPMIKFWSDRKMNISRIALGEDNVIAASTKKIVKNADSTNESTIKEIIYIIGADNLSKVSESLNKIFGTERGTKYYHDFRSKHEEYRRFVNTHTKTSISEKQKKYCSILFDLSKINMPDTLPEKAVREFKNSKNLNDLRAALTTEYGKKNMEVYYSIIKPHMNIIENIA